jgi:hypothetical protein
VTARTARPFRDPAGIVVSPSSRRLRRSAIWKRRALRCILTGRDTSLDATVGAGHCGISP